MGRKRQVSKAEGNDAKKLRTLNELFDGNRIRTAGDLWLEIRQEAIKWIKDMEDRVSQAKKFDPNTIVRFEVEMKAGAFIIGYEATIDWIKHFFNVAEEDLK